MRLIILLTALELSYVQAFDAGYAARRAGLPRSANPYPSAAWDDGWSFPNWSAVPWP
jgi:hypothetical protein